MVTKRKRMIQRVLICFVLMYFGVVNYGCSDSKSKEISLYPMKQFEIKNVQMGFSKGKWSDLETSSCVKGFSLTPGQVKEFFMTSKVITYEEFDHLYDWAPCYLEGDLIKDGKEMLWKIAATGVGEIVISSKERIMFACIEKCKVIPAEPYTEDE